MKILKISRGLEVKLDDEDYKRLANVRGNYRSEPLRWQATRNNDTNATWYASKTINYKKWRLHRYIFYLRGINITNEELDHKNGDGLDNRFSNLRIATSGQNKANRGARSDNKLGMKGVERLPSGRYAAYTVKKGRKTHIGVYDTIDEAALAYNRAAIEQWGEYAWTNKVKRPVL